MITRPEPPTALVPRCTRCQSFVNPSIAEYWHIGETTILFFRVIFFIIRGENSFAIMIKNLRLIIMLTKVMINLAID